jgi:hypothetical protein
MKTELTRREFIAALAAGTAAVILDPTKALAGDPESRPGRTIDKAITLPLGVTHWTVENSYRENKRVFFKLAGMNPPETLNRYDLKISVPKQPDDPHNVKKPSINHITFVVFSPEQEGELHAWQEGRGDYPRPKATASMQSPTDPNYNGGETILHLEGLQPVRNDKGELTPWIGVLTYTANSNETSERPAKISEIERWWLGWSDTALPDQATVAIDASVYFSGN